MLFPFDDCLTEEERFGFVAYSICSGISGSVPVLMNVLKQVLLWILYVFVLSCVCYVFVRVCLHYRPSICPCRIRVENTH